MGFCRKLLIIIFCILLILSSSPVNILAEVLSGDSFPISSVIDDQPEAGENQDPKSYVSEIIDDPDSSEIISSSSEIQVEESEKSEEPSEIIEKSEESSVVSSVVKSEIISSSIIEEESTVEEKSSDVSVVEEDKNEEEEQSSEETEIVLINQALKAEDKSYVITVKGLLPKGGYLNIYEITEKDNTYSVYLRKAAEKVFADKDTTASSFDYARFFDIKILTEAGEEYQPAESVAVSIELKDGALSRDGAEVVAVHFAEKEQKVPLQKRGAKSALPGVEVEVMDASINGALLFDTEGFSVYGVLTYYTVDFYYYGPLEEYKYITQTVEFIPEPGDDEYDPEVKVPVEKRPFPYEQTEHHIDGGTDILLSQLLEILEVGVNIEDVTGIEFTDNTLIRIEKEADNEYRLVSLQPFTTYETLSLTMADGEIIEIYVRDAIAGPISFGTNLEWEITDDGTLIIRPDGENDTGILPNVSDITTTDQDDRVREEWPYLNYSSQILSVVIEPGVKTSTEIRHMFNGCTNLESVNLSNLDCTDLKITNDMFRNCTSLETLDLTGLQFGTLGSNQINRMFRGCTSLTSLTWPNVNLSRISQANNVFENCNNLKNIDISGGKVSQTAINALSTIENLNLSGVEFLIENMYQAFYAKTNLKTVNLSNAIFPTATPSFEDMFYNCTNLTSVDMSGTTLSGSLYRAFQDCSSLVSVSFENVTDAGITRINNMFNRCSSIEHIDLSSFDAKTIISVVNAFRNCTKLISLDISNVGGSITGNGDTGLQTAQNLKILRAENSKIKIVSNDNVFSFVQEGKWVWHRQQDGNDITETLTRSELETLTKTGTVTITRNDGTSVTLTNDNSNNFLPSGSYERAPDDEEIAEDPNMAGFGELPETFFLINKDLNNATVTIEGLDFDKLIVYYNKTEVTSQQQFDELQQSSPNGQIRVYTKMQTRSEWMSKGEKYAYDFGGPIVITFKDAAVDVNGKKHDLVFTINGFEFQNTDQLDAFGSFPAAGKFAKYLFRAFPGNLQLQNYVSDTTTMEDSPDVANYNAFVTGSKMGTYTDYTVTVKTAEPGASILIFVDDIDVSSNSQGAHEVGAEGIILNGGNELESVTISGGTNPSLLKRWIGDRENGFRVVTPEDADWNQGNYITGSRNDNGKNEPYSRFYVRADATGASYTWTSGTGCDTYLLKPNSAAGSFRSLDSIYINPMAIKTIEGKMPQPVYDKKFTFELKYAGNEQGVNPVKPADIPTTYSEKGVLNDINKATFSLMEFWHPRTDSDNQYIVNTYIYEVKESDKDESLGINANPYIVYTKDKKYMKVVVQNPENDAEMRMGFKAVVTTGTKGPDDTEIKWSDSSVIVWSDNGQLEKLAGVGNGMQVEDDGVLYDVRVDIHGVKYYKKGSEYYDYSTKTQILCVPGVFWPSNNDSYYGNRIAEVTAPDGQKYPVRMDANGSRYYVKDSKFYAAYDIKDGDDNVLVPAHQEMKSSESVNIPYTVDGYALRKDKNGTNYYLNTTDNKYYSEDGKNELKPVTGDVRPSDDDVLVLKDKTITINGIEYTIRVDIHNVEYYTKTISRTEPNGSTVEIIKYYDPTNATAIAEGTEIKVENTVFNPQKLTDKTVQEEATVQIGGKTYYVYEDIEGVQYCVDKTDPEDVKYYRPDGTLIRKKEGDIEPSSSDMFVEKIKTRVTEVTEVMTGNSNKVYRDRNKVKYYKVANPDGSYNYFAMNGDYLIPGHDVNPSELDIYIDSSGKRYYKLHKSDGSFEYYGLDGSKLTPDTDVYPGITDQMITHYTDVNGNRFYEVDNGGETYYFDVNGNSLGTEAPIRDIDRVITEEYGVYITEEDRVEFYFKDGKYFKASDDSPYYLPANIVDAVSVVNVGTFDNRFISTDIKITKKTVENKSGTFKYRISFNNTYKPTGILSQEYSISDETMVDILRVPGKSYKKMPGTGVPEPVLDGEGVLIGTKYTYQFDDGNQGIITIEITKTEVEEIVTETIEMNLDPSEPSIMTEIQYEDLVLDPGNGKISFLTRDGTLYSIDMSEDEKELSIAPSVWEFTLEENQYVVFKQLPMDTEYEIVEYEVPRGWSLKSIHDSGKADKQVDDKRAFYGGNFYDVLKDKNGVEYYMREGKYYNPETKAEIRPVAGTFEPNDGYIQDITERKVSGKIISDDAKDYEYTFTNQYTEIIIRKIVTGNLGNRAEEFEFEVELSGLEPNSKEMYAIEHDDGTESYYGNTIEFTTAQTDANGTIIISFKLKDQESIYLVVPYKADMKLTEKLNKKQTSEGYFTTFTVDGKNPTTVTPPYANRVRDGINPDKDEEILVENRINSVVPTEIRHTWASAVLIPIALLGLLMIFLMEIRQRRLNK